MPQFVKVFDGQQSRGCRPLAGGLLVFSRGYHGRWSV